MRCGTHGDEFRRDALRVIDGNGEANPDRPFLGVPESPPVPSAAIAEFIPMSSPFMSNSGPPELPGLSRGIRLDCVERRELSIRCAGGEHRSVQRADDARCDGVLQVER